MLDKDKIDALCNNSAYQASVVIPKLLKRRLCVEDKQKLRSEWLTLREAETLVLLRILEQASEGDRGCLNMTKNDKDVADLVDAARQWRESCLKLGILSFDRSDISILSLAISRICKKLRLSKWLLWCAIAFIVVETALLIKFW